MPRKVEHSTQCCGAHSFSGFMGITNQNANEIDIVVRGAPIGRLGDLTLNGRQVHNEVLMQRIADLGFVLDAHWINSVHASDVYRFTRCDTRRPLMTGPIAGRWNGMVLTSTLEGDLPLPAVAFRGYGQDRFHIGDVVHVLTGIRQGRQFTIEDTAMIDGDWKAHMRDPERDNLRFSISYGNLLLITAIEDAPAGAPAPLARVAHRHVGIDPQEVPAPAVAPPAPVRVLFQTYHNTFQDGRRGAGYDSYDLALAARGRRTRIDRRSIMSDGTIVWTDRVQGN